MYFRISSTAIITVFIFLFSAPSAHSLFWSYDMWEQPSIQPYQQPLSQPEGTVTTDGTVIGGEVDRDEIEQITSSPVRPTTESIEAGEQLYANFCAVCHGQDARGMGPIIEKGHGFYPVDLTSSGVAQRTDGYLYATIYYGGKVMMPAYKESLSPERAWHIVNYIRNIQGKTTATTEE